MCCLFLLVSVLQFVFLIVFVCLIILCLFHSLLLSYLQMLAFSSLGTNPAHVEDVAAKRLEAEEQASRRSIPEVRRVSFRLLQSVEPERFKHFRP